jgi:predicted regulator of Ras-like GTPase activity (Roadblock/LC7/MglB family)
MNDSDDNRLGWMLDDALRMPETRHAILFSADGLLRARSRRIDRDDAERHAAAMSGLQSLARATAAFCGDAASPWRQTINEFDCGYVFLCPAAEGSFLAVSTTERVDIEAVSFRLHELVQRLGAHMTSQARDGTGGRL